MLTYIVGLTEEVEIETCCHNLPPDELAQVPVHKRPVSAALTIILFLVDVVERFVVRV